jgi:hypothetical protein
MSGTVYATSAEYHWSAVVPVEKSDRNTEGSQILRRITWLA